jgi:hypothetical protein
MSRVAIWPAAAIAPSSRPRTAAASSSARWARVSGAGGRVGAGGGAAGAGGGGGRGGLFGRRLRRGLGGLRLRRSLVVELLHRVAKVGQAGRRRFRLGRRLSLRLGILRGGGGQRQGGGGHEQGGKAHASGIGAAGVRDQAQPPPCAASQSRRRIDISHTS